jgi:hypothetical protein
MRGNLRSAVGSGGSPVHWKSDLNPSASDKIQPPLIVDQEESFTDIGGDRESWVHLGHIPYLLKRR